MQNAPARQPRVSPAAPRTGRAWVTAASLVAAGLIAGVVMVPPFAAGTLFPSRSIASSYGASGAVETVAASGTVAQSGDGPDRTVEAKYTDVPLAAEPADEPPRGTASAVAPDASEPTGTLATGVFAARLVPEAGVAPSPPQLDFQPIPPLVAAPAAPAEATPTISPPPARREPLPLQTDLLPAATRDQPAIAKPAPDRHG